MILYKGHIRVIRVLGLGVPSRGPSYCALSGGDGGGGGGARGGG